MTTVVNIKNAVYDVYIGRRKDSIYHFGNPASHLENSLAVVKVKTREEAVQFYEDWLNGLHPMVEPNRREWILQRIPRLRGKILGCHCWPKSCHGDILIKLADKEIDNGTKS